MKTKTVTILLTLIFVSLLIPSCRNRPKEVLNRKRMEQLMYDVYIAEATIDNDYSEFSTPEKKEAYIDKIFRAHNVTQAQWDTSLSWYSDRIDLYMQMNDSVKARLKRAQTSVDHQIGQIGLQTTDPDIEIYSFSDIPERYSFKTPGAQKNGFRFQLDSAEISRYMPSSHFVFNLNAIGVPSSGSGNMTSALMLVYGDTTIYRVNEIDENRNYSTIVSKYINRDTLTQIFGFVRLESLPGNTPNIQLYDIYFGGE